MNLKYLPLNDALYRYACAQRSDAPEPVLAALRRETEGYGQEAECQISQEQGTFMQLLATVMGARSALEVGTFTGYSSICIARGLGSEGRLLCVDECKEWTDVARRYWEMAGLSDRIELRLGPALSVLGQLEPDRIFDFVFVDAAKGEYDAYYELILPHVRSNGLILFDNMLWGGRLISDLPEDSVGRVIDRLNHKLARDPRVETVLLPIADGVQVCRKL